MKTAKPLCSPEEHAKGVHTLPAIDPGSVERCARIFRAIGETSRLRLVARLVQGPTCVGDLAAAEDESITTISQRLRVLRADHIVDRKRNGKHVLYFLTDQHMYDLITNGLAHASETHHQAEPASRFGSQQYLREKGIPMTTLTTEHAIHPNHTHEHGEDCGHTTIEHNDHVDFLHNGHMHHPHEGHVDEHRLDVTAANPETCTEGHACDGHDAQHVHGADCGHEAVPHGDHVDYLVEGHLHHQHEGHCDNHGNVTVAQ